MEQGIGKSVSFEEKSEQPEKEAVSIPAAQLVEYISGNTHENIQFLDDEEEFVEKEQPKTVHKTEKKKACEKPEFKSEKVPKKKRKVDSSRFDRAIQMFDMQYENRIDDNFELGK